MRKLLIAVLGLLLVGCGQTIDVGLEPEVDLYYGEKSDQKVRLTASDPAYTALTAWLSEHSSDWYTTSGRYPGGVYIKAKEYGVQITKRNVVLYSLTSTPPKALYIQKRDQGELSEFSELIRKPKN